MLDGLGKLLERLILQRLHHRLEDEENGLSLQQHGFRPGRSTIVTIKTIRDACQGSLERSENVVLIALDIRNAFNSAQWCTILDALARIGTPAYLIRMISSYFSESVLEYECMGKSFQQVLTASVPQGSVLGPALWNVMYDGLLIVPMPEDASMFAFADDVAILIRGKTTSFLCLAAQDALLNVKRWLDGAGLKLAVYKTKAVFFTRHRKLSPPEIAVDGFRVPFSRSMRYLDNKLRFAVHAEQAAAKAARVAEELARLMPNVGGSKQKALL